MELSADLKFAPLANNETYAYREAGKSHKILIFIHGNQSSSFYFETIFPYFSKEYRIIAPDLREYGLSTCYKPPNSLDDLVEDLKLFVEKLGIEQFALLGWSLGGGIAMKFAAKYPSYVTKLILLHSIGVQGLPKYLVNEKGENTQIRAKNFEEILLIPSVEEVDLALKEKDRNVIEARVLKVFFGGRFQPDKELLDALVTESLHQKSFFLSSHMLNTFNISDENNGVSEGTGEIHKIQCPTLIICGKKDTSCPVEEGEKIAKYLGEKAQIKIFEDCGHCAIFDYPEEFTNLVKEFLKN